MSPRLKLIVCQVRDESFSMMRVDARVTQFVNREHGDPTNPQRVTRAEVWRWYGERTPSGHEIFRTEPFNPAQPDIADDNPRYDERNIYVPLSPAEAEERAKDGHRVAEAIHRPRAHAKP